MAIISTDMSNERMDHGTPELGRMNSMSPECTPLKHKYDNCFHAWFKDYLDKSSNPKVIPSTSPTQILRSSRANQAPATDPAALRERYESDCGKLFRDYQACIKVGILC